MFGLDPYDTGRLLLAIAAIVVFAAMAFCGGFEARKYKTPDEVADEDPSWVSIDKMYEELKKDGWYR